MLWLGSLVIMMPFVVVGLVFDKHLSYDLIADLPADSASVTGTKLLEEHFPAGLVGPITVTLVDPNIDFTYR